MARKRATMREGPLAELFRKTEAAQRSQGDAGRRRGSCTRARAGSPRAGSARQDRRARPRLREGSRPAPGRRGRRSSRARGRGADGGCRVTRSRPLLPDDARAGAAAPSRAAAERLRVHRGDSRRGRGWRRAERDPSDDGRGDRPGGLHRREHRPAGARDLGRADEDLDRRRSHAGARLGCRPGGRTRRRRGGDGSAEGCTARLGHGVRHRGRGRRHRHRSRTGRRARRARARRAHGGHRHHAVPLRGNPPPRCGGHAGWRIFAPRATPSSSFRTIVCSRCSTARPR